MDPVVRRRTGQQVVFHLMAAVALFDYLLIRSGFGSYPSLSVLLDISTTLPQLLDLPPHAQYLHHSPLGPALARLVGVDTPVAFQVLHVAVFAIALAIVVLTVVRRLGSTVGWTVIVAFVTSQSAVVLAAWIGSYDVFTWVCGSAIVLARTPRRAAIAGLVAAFSVFEQVFISVVLLAAVTALNEPVRRNRYVHALLGLVLGRLLLLAFLRANGVDYDRLYWLRDGRPSRYLEQLSGDVPLFVLTAFGGAWVIVIALIGVMPVRERVAWSVAVVLAAASGVLGEDPTRVSANVTWPIVLALVLRSAPTLARPQLWRMNAFALVAGIVIPPIFLWAGDAHLADHHVWRALT